MIDVKKNLKSKKDNIIFTDGYGIEYNWKIEWLIKNDKNDVIMNVTDENENDNDNGDIKYIHKGINKIKTKEKYNLFLLFLIKKIKIFFNI